MMPDFIIIGAPRTGTTSLYHYLGQHPQINMSRIKESNFFAYLASQAANAPLVEPILEWPVRSLQEYMALFPENKAALARGEASPFYFYVPGVPEQIRKHAPHVQLLAILRDPSDRAYSMYLKNVREGVEARSFRQVMNDELADKSGVIKSQNHILRAGLYFQHLSRFLRIFPREKLKIYFYDDFASIPQRFIQKILNDLGVDASIPINISVRFNRGARPLLKKNRFAREKFKVFTTSIRKMIPRKLYFFLLQIQDGIQQNLMNTPELPDDLRRQLQDIYREDVEKLQGLVGRDLSSWLSVK